MRGRMGFRAWVSVAAVFFAGCGPTFSLELGPSLVTMSGLEARVGVIATGASSTPIALSAELLDFNTPYPGAWTVKLDEPNLTQPQTSLLATLPSIEGPSLALLRVTGVRGSEEAVAEGVLDLRSLGTWTPRIIAPDEVKGGQPFEVTIETTAFNVAGTLSATLWFEVAASSGGAATSWRAEVAIDRTRDTVASWTANYGTLPVTGVHEATLTLDIRFEPGDGRFVFPNSAEVKRPVRIVP
jgi:hypothetical protein